VPARQVIPFVSHYWVGLINNRPAEPQICYVGGCVQVILNSSAIYIY
jgi:hypothetical protein